MRHLDIKKLRNIVNYNWICLLKEFLIKVLNESNFFTSHIKRLILTLSIYSCHNISFLINKHIFVFSVFHINLKNLKHIDILLLHWL